MSAIHPRAVKDFLARKRDSHLWMKKLTDAELDSLLEDLKFKPARKKPGLDKHQKVCIILGILYECFAFWLDMGGGKTRVALELLNYWYKRKKLKQGLILGPSESVINGWEKQIEYWNIKIPFVTLMNGATADKWDTVAELDKGLIIASYAGLSRMVSKLKRNKKKKKNELKTNKSLLQRLNKHLDAVVLDEATKIGNHGSLFYKSVVKTSKNSKFRLELAGRPFGRDPQMLWSQMYMIDRGYTLGETLGIFRAALFETKKNYWGGYDHKFKKENRKLLRKIVRHRSIQYSEKEMGHKFKKTNQLEEVSLPDEAQAYYEQALKLLKRVHAGYKERENAFIRMRQISSGFLGMENDTTGDKISVEFADNPKRDRLIELIQEMPEKRKGVIFHEFIPSGNIIEKALKKHKIKYLRLKAGIKNTKEIERKFDNDPSYKVLLTSHRLSAYGSNYQVANYLFVYEAPVPVIDDEQMRKRLPRKGQKRTVHEYDLVCRDTVDGRILAFHAQGQNLFDAVIRNRVKL